MSGIILAGEVAGTRVALPVDDVRSVIELGQLVRVPHAPPHVAGVTAVRSQALTVIDSRVSLGLAPGQAGAGAKAAVILREGHTYAVLLDRIDDVHEAAEPPKPVPSGCGPHWRRAAVGVVELAGGPALLVDPAVILSGPARDQA